MIESVTVTNHIGESLELVLRAPEKSGLAITGITGLGPTKANINVTDMVTKDGGLFNSARMEKRNIVFTLACWYMKEGVEDFSIEDSRQLTYKYFPAKKPIRLEFKTDNRDCYIDGYVETCEPEIFSERETIQVSVICPDPFFYSVDTDDNSQTFYGAEHAFEFPFENPDIVLPKIEFSYLLHHPAQPLYYDGEYQTGFRIIMHMTGEVHNPIIYNLSTGESMGIKTEVIKNMTGSGLIAGDTIEINTLIGHKSVTLIRNGKEYNVINALRSQATWFTLSKGDNLFTYESEYGSGDINIKYKWSVGYEGI